MPLNFLFVIQRGASATKNNSEARAHAQRVARARSQTPSKRKRKNPRPKTETRELQFKDSDGDLDEKEISPLVAPVTVQGVYFPASVPTWIPNASAEEARSFHFYIERTAREWSGYQDHAFWNVRAPQEWVSHKSIFHGVVALGALHELWESSEGLDKGSGLQQLVWRQCSKACTADRGQTSLVVALMSCIILTCLQDLQNNAIAYTMLKTGIDIANNLETQIAEGTLSLTQHETKLLKEDLKPILERLTARYCYLIDLPSAFALHITTKTKQLLPRTASPNLPSVFNTLSEARNTLEKIVTWCMTNTISVNEETEVCCDKKVEVESLLQRWSELLESVDSEADIERSNFDTSRSLLKASGIVMEILFATLGSQRECIYDNHTTKFREIVRIYDEAGKISSETRKQKISFGIDAGIVHTLSFVIGRCRDPKIRRQALDLLKRDDYIEGGIRASAALNVLSGLVQFEEQGKTIHQQEDILEDHRMRIWEVQQFWHSGLVNARYVRAPYDPQRGAALQEHWTHMAVPSDNRVDSSASLRHNHSRKYEPNVVFARGTAAFLDETSGKCFEVFTSSMFLPLPKI